MDYYGLYKFGKEVWNTLGESRNIIFVAKKLAKPAAEVVVASIIGTIIEDTVTKMIEEKFNG